MPRFRICRDAHSGHRLRGAIHGCLPRQGAVSGRHFGGGNRPPPFSGSVEQTAVVVPHGLGTDHAPHVPGEGDTLPGVPPWGLDLRVVDQRPWGLGAVSLEHGVDRLPPGVGELGCIGTGDAADLVFVAMHRVEVRRNGTEGPCLDRLAEKGLPRQREMPGLAVIYQLLQLDGGESLLFFDDVLCHVLHAGHGTPLFFLGGARHVASRPGRACRRIFSLRWCIFRWGMPKSTPVTFFMPTAPCGAVVGG